MRYDYESGFAPFFYNDIAPCTAEIMRCSFSGFSFFFFCGNPAAAIEKFSSPIEISRTPARTYEITAQAQQLSDERFPILRRFQKFSLADSFRFLPMSRLLNYSLRRRRGGGTRGWVEGGGVKRIGFAAILPALPAAVRAAPSFPRGNLNVAPAPNPPRRMAKC